MNQIMNWVKAHPRLTAWIVLAVGMNAMVVYEARNVGLLVGQWVALVVATTLVAGLCVWIIGWEDDEDDEEAAAGAPADKSSSDKAPADKTSTDKASIDKSPAAETQAAAPPEKS